MPRRDLALDDKIIVLEKLESVIKNWQRLMEGRNTSIYCRGQENVVLYILSPYAFMA
jgi:hypothetical protein